jgi:hypothetical protein
MSYLAGALVSCTLSLFVDTSDGAIEGFVRYVDGQALPGVVVSAIRSDRPSVRKTVVSGASGFFDIPDLAVGAYHVTAELSGFTTQSHEVVISDGGPVAQIGFTLELASPLASIVVNREGDPMVDLTMVRTAAPNLPAIPFRRTLIDIVEAGAQ